MTQSSCESVIRSNEPSADQHRHGPLAEDVVVPIRREGKFMSLRFPFAALAYEERRECLAPGARQSEKSVCESARHERAGRFIRDTQARAHAASMGPLPWRCWRVSWARSALRSRQAAL